MNKYKEWLIDGLIATGIFGLIAGFIYLFGTLQKFATVITIFMVVLFIIALFAFVTWCVHTYREDHRKNI